MMKDFVLNKLKRAPLCFCPFLLIVEEMSLLMSKARPLPRAFALLIILSVLYLHSLSL